MKNPRDQWKPNYCYRRNRRAPLAIGDWRAPAAAHYYFNPSRIRISQFHPLRIGVTFIR